MIKISEQSEKQPISDKQQQEPLLIAVKRENFRQSLRKQDLSRIFNQHRDQSKTHTNQQHQPIIKEEQQSPEQQKLCPFHQNNEECNFHDIYTTIKILTYGYIDDFILKRQTDFQLLQKVSRKRDTYQHTKMKLIIQNGKYTYCYGRSFKQTLRLIQKGEVYSLDSPYVVKKNPEQKIKQEEVDENLIRSNFLPHNNSPCELNQKISERLTSFNSEKRDEQTNQQQLIQIDVIKESEQFDNSHQELKGKLKFCDVCKVVFRCESGLKQTLLRNTAPPRFNRKITFEESFQINQICAADPMKSTKKTTSICSQTIKSQSPNYIVVLTWNVSSLKSTTLKTAKLYGAHIICLQETRKEIQNSTSYSYYNRLRKENPTRGGGIAVGVYKQFFTKDLSNLLPQIDKQLECQLIQITGQRLEIFVLNVYSPKKEFFKKSKKLLENFLIDLSRVKQRAIFIVCGDFNQPKDQVPQTQAFSNKFKFMSKIYIFILLYFYQ